MANQCLFCGGDRSAPDHDLHCEVARDDPGEAARFAEYHAQNPQVYEVLRRFALEAKAAGRERLSINMLHERARWFTTVEEIGGDYKLNNNWRPFYSRLLMTNEPSLAGFFQIRHARADGER
jgi:hypothetical protein